MKPTSVPGEVAWHQHVVPGTAFLDAAVGHETGRGAGCPAELVTAMTAELKEALTWAKAVGSQRLS